MYPLNILEQLSRIFSKQLSKKPHIQKKKKCLSHKQLTEEEKKTQRNRHSSKMKREKNQLFIIEIDFMVMVNLLPFIQNNVNKK